MPLRRWMRFFPRVTWLTVFKSDDGRKPKPRVGDVEPRQKKSVSGRLAAAAKISSPGSGYDDGYGAQTNGDHDRYEGPPERYVASHGPGGTHSSSGGGSTPRDPADGA
ncbi:hypothetical protein HPB47_011401 [Ixodes persulcatus]|uniref:Uncharacterized protein n=1 Tax=Ixodes persulcatus TaxID=34615 RepID=A0AC60NWD3_IXOPE|nr:hypothetical protein HPB47_011401 [Ixodes persulcatus]